MTDEGAEKPEYEEWLHWARVVIDRLATCAQVYSKPPYQNVGILEKTRQQKNGQTVNLLKRVHALTDESETPSDFLLELDQHGERMIDGLALLFGETLRDLPGISDDMQKLLKSPWCDKCNGRLADELFRGPMGNEAEGIGSGHPDQGRLPGMLRDLLMREQAGDGRVPREALAESEPRREDGTARRWGERNSRMFRSAGRVE